MKRPRLEPTPALDHRLDQESGEACHGDADAEQKQAKKIFSLIASRREAGASMLSVTDRAPAVASLVRSA